MPLAIVRLKPGIDVEETQTLNAGAWSACQLIRFRDGLPEKLGGWAHLSNSAMVGTARGMHCWADFMGNPYLVVGSEQRLMVLENGILNDITPLRVIDNPAVNLSTVLNSATVTVIDAATPTPSPGDWINVVVPIAVGGLIIQGLYLVQTASSATTFTIAAAGLATATVNNGGAVPSFTAPGASSNITVTLAAHGLVNGALFAVQVATLIGGVTIAVGSYPVSAVTANTFVITPGGTPTAATVAENSGNAQLQYLIASGVASATALTGYGVGGYGNGGYGLANAGQLTQPLRQWFLSNYNQILIGNYTNGPLYLWTPPTIAAAQQLGGSTPNAISAPAAPTIVNSSFLSMPAGIVVALGSDVAGNGSQDPNLISWSDVVPNFNVWTPLAANQAGSFRLPTGSRIIGGIQGPQFALIWTDVDLYAMQYLNAPLIFGFQKIANSTDLISARAVGIFESKGYWLSNNNFHVYDGNAVSIVPCPVWDKLFLNVNRFQKDKIFCAVNSWFAEVMWFYPSATGSGEVDSYVKYNVRENVWDFGTLTRTCWEDDNVFGAPIGADQAGLLQQHETGYDNDGLAMVSFVESGYFSIAEGTHFTFVERLLPDLVISGGNQTVQLTVTLQDYPSDTPATYGPFSVTPATPYVIVRARNRVAALTVGSNALGVFWRLGGTRYLAAPAGRR